MIKENILLNKELPKLPGWKELARKINFWRVSYSVDENYPHEVDAIGENMIVRHDCEERIDYNKRLTRCKPRNYVGPIVDQYVSIVLRQEPEGPEQPWRSKALENVLIDGVGWLGTWSMSETGMVSQAQASELYSFFAPADSVVNYTEVDGELFEAIIKMVDDMGESFYRYLNKEEFIDIKVDDKNVVKSMEEGVHYFDGVPLVKLSLDIANASFISSISNIQKKLANLDSLLTEEIYSNVFTRFVFSGINDQEEEEGSRSKGYTVGNKRILTVRDQIKIDRLGSDKSQADSIRESIKDEEHALYRSVGMNADPVTNVSGIALKLDREKFYLFANKMATMMEAGENELNRLMGIDEEVVYNRDFLPVDYSEEILKLRDILALGVPDDIKQYAVEEFRRLYVKGSVSSDSTPTRSSAPE